RLAAGRCNHAHPAANQVSREARKSIVLTLRPAVFDHDVLTFEMTGCTKASAECLNKRCEWSGRCAVEKTDHRHRRLLRARRERPRRRRTAEQRDELAAFHSNL